MGLSSGTDGRQPRLCLTLAAGCQATGASRRGGRCISAEIRIRRIPMRPIDEPEITVFGDTGRRG
eukprot:10523448-Lingulodinium_polyedra.AAC.1